MKSILRNSQIFVICFALQSVTFAGEGYGKRDGYYWKGIDQRAERLFSEADWTNTKEWIDGEAYDLKFQYILGIYDLYSTISSNLYSKYLDKKRKTQFLPYGKQHPDINGTTPDQMVKGIDKFYDDYRNMKVLIFDAMHVVQMEITGKPLEEIEWRTRYYRADEETQLEMMRERWNKK